MATYLLRKEDPVVLRAWLQNSGGRGGSPEQFGKRVALLSARMERGDGDQGSTRLRTTAWQRGIRLLGIMLQGRLAVQAPPALDPLAIAPAGDSAREGPEK